MHETTRDRLVRVLRAGARGLALLTAEEDRAARGLESVAAKLGWNVRTWSAASGVDEQGKPQPLEEVLGRLRREHDDVLWTLVDGTASLSTPTAIRTARELCQRTHGPAVVFVGERLGALEHIPELVVEVLPLADEAELVTRIGEIGAALDAAGYVGAHAELAARAPELARQAVGLELRTFERLLAEVVLDVGADANAIATMLPQRKPDALDRFGLLERVHASPLDELGGFSQLKSWLHRRRLALAPEARNHGIPAPRGLLLVGIQGCGKSLAARACASALELPLCRLEPGRLFGGTVGESEYNLRRVTATAERLAPIVLWIDEIEKGFAGSEGAASDAGTAARVLGGFLTWLQERQRPVFVVATANRIAGIPPELLRRGRLDEIFFVDLPDPDERVEILRVHVERVPARTLGRVPGLKDPWPRFASLAREAEGYSGAELEAALVEARLMCFAEGRPLAADDVRLALSTMVPLSRSHAEAVAGIRSWARERARRA